MMPVNYNTPCWVPLTFYWNPGEQISNRMDFVGKITNNMSIYDEWIQCMVNFTDYYETQNVMYSFANDFAFYDAPNSYGMMDDIMQVVKNRTDMFELRYSTVSEYYHAVRKERHEKNLALQIFHDDFFPME